jgi:hypothetical protein
MDTIGSLVLSMTVVVPTSLKYDDKYRFKRQVLTRFNCCTVEEARIYKQRFLELNHHLTADEVHGEWTVREFI